MVGWLLQHCCSAPAVIWRIECFPAFYSELEDEMTMVVWLLYYKLIERNVICITDEIVDIQVLFKGKRNEFKAFMENFEQRRGVLIPR